MCMNALPAYVCAPRVPSAHRAHKTVPDSLKLELGMAASHHAALGIKPQSAVNALDP